METCVIPEISFRKERCLLVVGTRHLYADYPSVYIT